MAGEVDRKEWAKAVQELMDAHTKGKKATFANRVGVNERTVRSWLYGAVDVKESSVRAVAEAFDINPMQLLIQVGYYAVDEMPFQPTPERIDEEQRLVVSNPSLSDEVKALILAELEQMRAADERLLEEQRDRDKQRRMRELEFRIEQARRAS